MNQNWMKITVLTPITVRMEIKMEEIKKITGKIIGWSSFYKFEKNTKKYRDILILEDKRVIEIYGKKKLEFCCMDEMEFFGKDCGDYFYVFSFKVLKKYVPPIPPINPQKLLSDFKK